MRRRPNWTAEFAGAEAIQFWFVEGGRMNDPGGVEAPELAVALNARPYELVIRSQAGERSYREIWAL